MIELDAVSKRYGPKTVIHDLSFAVGKGEIVGFLGPNGAGKTTTLRMIAGFTTASSGRVLVGGHDMAVDNIAAARSIGYLPERPPLYDSLDVRGYLRFVAKAKGVPRREMSSELDRVTTCCRLGTVFRREIYKLSKGYRQRVGLAQALLGQPQVLLLDEPTIGLDPGQIQETRELIREFGAAHAVLFSTHILSEVAQICQRVAIIHHGRLVAIDSPTGLQQALAETEQVTLRVTAPAEELRQTLLDITGVSAVQSRRVADGSIEVDCQVKGPGVEAAMAGAVAGRWQLHALARKRPTLENVFLHYIENRQAV